ncbi:hypothetical protein Tco_0218236 [Tanacetum coccineum]
MVSWLLTGARIGPSNSSRSLSIAHQWDGVIDWGSLVFHSLHKFTSIGLSGPSDGVKIDPIVFFSPASGLMQIFSIDSDFDTFGIWP